jgi:hypothetical protein
MGISTEEGRNGFQAFLYVRPPGRIEAARRRVEYLEVLECLREDVRQEEGIDSVLEPGQEGKERDYYLSLGLYKEIGLGTAEIHLEALPVTKGFFPRALPANQGPRGFLGEPSPAGIVESGGGAVARFMPRSFRGPGAPAFGAGIFALLLGLDPFERSLVAHLAAEEPRYPPRLVGIDLA